MSNVEISIEGGGVITYWLSIFGANGYQFRGEANQYFNGDLNQGQYTLLYHVIGGSKTDFEIIFDDVKQPESPYPRRIPNKSYTAATITIVV